MSVPHRVDPPTDDASARANRLADQSSPYLLQHAHNPVDWYPWGEEALDRAGREAKPILLSIGYAACHWCHVMERESFEDEGTAALMNEHFVCVKVDREERPDLDGIYMEAVQLMTGSGGWPMTVFLTPEGRPFYAGTYFPREERHGLPAFTTVLSAVAQVWRDNRERALEQGRRVAEGIARAGSVTGSSEPLTEDILRRAHAVLEGSFDPEWGGFGAAPKFPQPMTLEFLLRCHLRGYEGALRMVGTTLDRMAGGGIHDQVGGGFHRYSTDGRWHVPHFEKMLYDNAQMARLYLHAWQVTGQEGYRLVAVDTLEYLLREMRHPEGGFFSSQDADSEGAEGRFFVWSWNQLAGLVGERVALWFGARPEGNWDGTNVLWVPAGEPEEGGPDGAELEAARRLLLEGRERRPHPSTDDKVVAAWNGLAVTAFAEAGRVLGEPRYVQAARDALRFVLDHLMVDGRLRRAWRDGRVAGPAFCDDYGLLGLGALSLYETVFETWIFRQVRSLAQDLLRLFRDPDGGGFFQTGSDAQTPVTRPKDLFDNAVPSGNSAGAELLQRAALLTGEEGWEQTGTSALRVVRPLMERAPSALGHALSALDLYVGPARQIAIVGEAGDPATRALAAEADRRFLPNAVRASGAPGDAALREIAVLRDRTLVDGKPAAHVCEGFICRLPVTDPAALAEQLDR